MKFSQFFLAIYTFSLVVLSGIPELTIIEDFLGGILVFIFVIELLNTGDLRLPWHSIIYFLILFFLVALLSVLEQPEAIRRFISFSLVLILFYVVFAIVKKSNNVKGITYGLSLGFLLLFIFNYEQVQLISEGVLTERFSGALNANNFSFLLVITIAFLVRPLFLIEEKEISRINILIRSALIIFLAFLILGVVGSRRGMLALLLVFTWCYFHIFKNHSFLKKAIISFIFFVCITFIFSWFQETPFYERFQNLFLFATGRNIEGEGSLPQRMAMIYEGIDMWAQKPLFGWGFDSFRFESSFGTYSHNNYIELLVNNGIVGFIFYYSFIGLIFLKGIRKYNYSHQRGLISWAILLILMVLLSDLAVVSYYQKYNAILLGVALGTVLNVDLKR